MKRKDSENKPTVPALDEIHQANENLSVTNHHGLCFIIDSKGMIKYVDNIYKRTRINYSPNKSFYELLVPEYHESAKAVIDLVFSGTSNTPTSSFSVNAYSEGKAIQSLSVIASPYSQEKEIKLVSLICHQQELTTQEDLPEADSTEVQINQQIQKLENQNKKLTKVNHFLDSFVTGAAHDLRSPLVVLKTFPDLIRRFKDENKKIAALDMMKDATIRMENILNNMMELVDFQKNDKHRKEEVSFEELFQSIFFQLSFETKDINPTFLTNFKKAPRIKYYKAHLNSIIYNLISNAIKYRKEEEELKIEITTQQSGPFILFEIKDNGLGIDLEKFGHLLFQPFKRLNTTRKGTGLGLSMIKSNIEINGGKIEVESEQGKGSTFKVYLMPYQS